MSIRRNTLFILNPNAGKGRGVKLIPQMNKLLCQLGIPLENLIITKYPGHATEIIKAISNSDSIIYSIGGDGSLNEIVNGLNNHNPISLGVIPVGSGNDFARAIGNLNKVFSLEKYLVSDKVGTCDIGHLSISMGDNVIVDKKFISSLGIGFDAQVAHKIKSIKYLKGLLLYLASVFICLISYKAPKSKLEILAQGVNVKDKIFLFTVGNTETAGGGFKLNPGAEINDGFFNLCMAKNISKMTLLRVLPLAIFGTHIKDKNVLTYKFKELTYSTSEKICIHTDGETIELAEGDKKIEISVKDQKQKIILI